MYFDCPPPPQVLVRPFAVLPRQGVRCTLLPPPAYPPLDEAALRDTVLQTELVVEATGGQAGEGGEVWLVRLPEDSAANQSLLGLLASVG